MTPSVRCVVQRRRWAPWVSCGALAFGCGGPGADGDHARAERRSVRAAADCRQYRPAEAKRTYDGRVGSIVLHNASGGSATARVYHPDGDGTQPEESWTLAAGADSALGGGFGSDWGLQVGAGCTVLLGRAAGWTGTAFVATWTGDTLLPGAPRRDESATHPN